MNPTNVLLALFVAGLLVLGAHHQTGERKIGSLLWEMWGERNRSALDDEAIAAAIRDWEPLAEKARAAQGQELPVDPAAVLQELRAFRANRGRITLDQRRYPARRRLLGLGIAPGGQNATRAVLDLGAEDEQQPRRV